MWSIEKLLMRILLLDNGSKYLEACEASLKGHEVLVLGYPNVPELLRKTVPFYERIVFTGDSVPLGIDLPYEKILLKILHDFTVPVLAVGRAGALFLEARGAKIRSSAGEYQIKKMPDGWSHNDVEWRNRKGDVVLLQADVEMMISALKKFIH